MNVVLEQVAVITSIKRVENISLRRPHGIFKRIRINNAYDFIKETHKQNI